MGLERLIIKNKKCVGYFLADQQSSFYQSAIFNQILLSVQNQPDQFSIKEKETRNGLRLLLVVNQAQSIKNLLDQLQKLQ